MFWPICSQGRNGFFRLSVCLLACAFLALVPQASAVTLGQTVTVQGLNENGFLDPGTTEITFTVVIFATDESGPDLTALGVKTNLPAGWTYNGLLPGANNPTIQQPASGGFAWIVPPALPFSFAYKYGVPANISAPVDIGVFTEYRLGGGAIVTPTTNFTIGPEPTNVSVQRALSGTGIAGNNGQYFVPGGIINVVVTFVKSGPEPISALSFQDVVSNGITISNIGGTALPSTAPVNGSTGTFDFSWNVVPAFPFSLTYSLTVPGDRFDPIGLSGVGAFEIGLDTTPTNTIARNLTFQPCVSFTRTPAEPCYTPGEQVEVTLNFDANCPQGFTAFGFEESLPAGWTFASVSGANVPDIVPPPGATNLLEFAYIAAPTFPASFTYVVNVPADETANPANISGQGVYRLGTSVALYTAPVTTPVDNIANCQDTTPPVVTLNGLASINVQCSNAFTDPGATAVDDVDGDISGQIVISGFVNVNNPGQYTLTYRATDQGGNIGQATRTVFVIDTQAPALSLVGAAALTVQCGAIYNEPGFIASDACAGNLQNSVLVSGVVNTSIPGVYTLTYNVSDPSGNNAPAVTRTITVADGSPPSLELNGSAQVTVTCGGTFADPGTTANDNCDGVLTSLVVRSGTLNLTTPGTYTLTYNVSDSAGNAALPVTRQVRVVDETAPVITINGASPINVACGSTYQDLGATAVDACQGVLTSQIVRTGTVNTAVPGNYTITYTVTDASGNVATRNRIVQVADTTAPVIQRTGAASVTVNCGSTYTDLGGTATDLCDSNVAVTVNASQVNTSVPGSYTVTLTARDAAGNNATPVTREVVVVDSSPPVITLNGAATVTVNCGGNYFELGATATDVCLGNLNNRIVRTGTVDTATPGVYEVRYNVSDDAGNAATTAIRTVTVVDNTPPTTTLLGGATTTVQCGDPYSDAGATATDLCDGNLNGAIVVTGSVSTDTPGQYVLTYSVSDAAGNAATSVTRTVTVVDTIAPVITRFGSATLIIACAATYTDPGAAAIDTCDADVAVTVNSSGVIPSVPGSYSVVFTATDAAGNRATASRNVIVVSAPFCQGEGEGGTEGEGEGFPEGEGEGTPEGEGDPEGEGEGEGQGCPDLDRNGLIDDPFACLTQDGDSDARSVNSANCRKTVGMTTWFGGVEGGPIELSIENPDDPNQVLSVTAARGLINPGEQAILIAAFSCDLVSLVGAEERPAFGSIPTGFVSGGAYFDVSIIVSRDGGATYSEVRVERLVQNPVDVRLNGMLFTSGATPVFQSHASRIVNDPATGTQLLADVGPWSVSGLVQLNSDATSMSARYNRLSVIAPFEGAPIVPILSVEPNPGSDFLIGISRIDRTVKRELVLRNRGAGTLTGRVDLQDATETFFVVGDPGFSIPAGGSTTITFGFTPTALGDYAAVATITGGIGGPVVFNVKGSGAEIPPKRFYVLQCGAGAPASNVAADLLVVGLALLGLFGARRLWARAR